MQFSTLGMCVHTDDVPDPAGAGDAAEQLAAAVLAVSRPS